MEYKENFMKSGRAKRMILAVIQHNNDNTQDDNAELNNCGSSMRIDNHPATDSLPSTSRMTDENIIRECMPRHEVTSLQEDLYLSDDDDSVADPTWEVEGTVPTNSEEENCEMMDSSEAPTPETVDPEIPVSEPIHSGVLEPHTSTSTLLEINNERNKKRKKTTRWNKRREETYERNLERNLKYKCLPYKDYKGRVKSPKAPKECVCNCKFNCTGTFSQDERINICKTYWGLADYARQKDFLLMHIKSCLPKRRLENASRKRTSAKTYLFEKDGSKIRVCQNFFQKTLCISNGPINKAFEKFGTHGNFASVDGRGRHQAYNKTSQSSIDSVKRHIEQFPTMESHYCRKTSSKLYLASNLSITKMYKLYVDQCTTRNQVPVSLYVYRQIFCTEYNLSFHKPKKDQCLMCHKYKQAAMSKPQNFLDLEAKYNRHIKLKNQSYVAKDADKLRANNDTSFASITLDLQQVLHIPSGDVSLLYYLRKLNVYNAAIYEARVPNNAFCIMWSEINGKKGSNEIGTALYKWMNLLPTSIKNISIFSDTCAGQNRNQYLTCLLLFLVQTTHFDVIEQKYLESGHSYMEADSIHSAIENMQKNVPVYSMIDWINIVKLARSKRKMFDKKNIISKDPYIPIELKYSDILDLKDLAAQLMRNRSIDNDGQTVQWLKLKCMRFQKDKPNIVLFRYDYESTYKELNVSLSEREQQYLKNKKHPEQNSLKSRRVLRNRDALVNETESFNFNYATFHMKPAYSKPLCITKAKKADLLKMCKNQIIPSELHNWYQSLPDAVKNDYLPESDVDDDTEEDHMLQNGEEEHLES